MMPSEVTELLRPLRVAYCRSVRNVALEIMAKFPWPTDADKDDRFDSERDDAIVSRLEGTSWVIYTHSAAAVLMVSDNDDAADDMLGEEEAKQCSVEHRASLAMLADVRELIEAFRLHGVPTEASRS